MLDRVRSPRFHSVRPFSIAVVTALVGTVVLTTSPASAATGPTYISAATVGAPLTIDLTHGSSSAGISIHAADSSGIADADVVADCTSGCSTGQGEVEGDQGDFTGPMADSVGNVAIEIPQNAQTGTWAVTKITLTNGNSDDTVVTGAALGSPAPSFTVTKSPDTTAPVLTGISLPGGTLDVTSADKPAALTVQVTDDVAGFDHGSITMGCDDPSCVVQGLTEEFDFDTSNLQTGTPMSGTYLTPAITFGLDQAGIWTADSVTLVDAYGNSATTDDSTFSFSVTAAADTAGPLVIGSPQISPDPIDATTDDQTTNLTIQITDDVTGFSDGSGELSDGNPSDPLLSVDIEPSMLTDPATHTYTVPIDVPVQTPASRYSFTSLILFDRADNETNVDVSSFPTLDVTTIPDLDGPSLTNLQLGPDPLNVADNPDRSLELSADITDATSGFDSATVRTIDPSGDTVDFVDAIDSSNLTSGTTQSGHYVAEITPGEEVDPADLVGTWTIFDIDLSDAASNVSSQSLSSTFTVSDTATADQTAPTLVGGSIVQPAVSTAGGDATVDVQLHATDAGTGAGAASGVAEVDVTLQSPSGFDQEDGEVGAEGLISGTDVDGVYDIPVTIPQYDEPGAWTISTVTLIDNADNENDLRGGRLFAAVGSPSVQVSGPIDLHGPVLASLTAAPTTIDTGSDRTVTFAVHATDDQATNDGSGVGGGVITLTSPVGQPISASFDENNLVSGSPTDGQYLVSLTLAKLADPGTWSVSAVLFDNVMNDTTISNLDLEALGATNTSTITVTGAADTRPPVVTGLTFNPTSVSTTNGGVPLVVDVHATDDQATSDGSGVAAVSIALDPQIPFNGTEFNGTASLVSGTPSDGWWEAVIDVEPGTPSGQWNVTLDATDNAGNDGNYDRAALASAGLPTSISITGQIDTGAPTLTALTLPATPVDVTGGDQVVHVGLHLKDSDGNGGTGSGVSSGVVRVAGPNSTTAEGDFDSSDLTAGTATDGTWEVPITIDRWTQPGTWHVTEVVAGDNRSNFMDLKTADLAAFTTSFTVASTPDSAPPTLTSATLTPGAIDVSPGPQLVTVTAAVSDDVSGFASGSVGLDGPGGATGVGTLSPTPASGSATNGTFTGQIEIPQYAPAGTWSIGTVSLTDNANNQVLYGGPGPRALPAAAQGSVTVTDTAPDTEAPVVAGIDITPDTVDLSTGPKQVTVNLHLTDNESGVFTGGTVSISGPSGGYDADLTREASGTPTDGVWPVVFDLPTTTANGTWTVTNITIQDRAGNGLDTGDGLPATKTFTVTGGTSGVPDAPTGVTATPQEDQELSVEWVAPADNGSPVTGYKVQYSSDDGGTWIDGPAATLTSDSADVEITGLTDGTTYRFRVAAINANGTGNYSATSAAVTVETTAPGEPTNVSGTPGNQSVALKWSAPADTGGLPITGYRITSQRDGHEPQEGPISAETSTATSATVTGLTNGVQYLISVAAINANGVGFDSQTPAFVTPGQMDASKLTVAGTKAIKEGAKVTLTATLTDNVSHAPIAGASVRTLQKSGKSGGLVAFGPSHITNSHGVVSVSVKPSVNAQYAFRFAGTSSHVGTASAIEKVNVAAVVSIAESAKRIKHTKSVQIYGVVTPNESGQTVVLQQLVKGKWKALSLKAKLKRQKLPNRKTAVGYVITVKESKKGTYTFRAVRAATKTNAAGASKPIKLKVT